MTWTNDFFILKDKTIVIIDTDTLLLEVLNIALHQEGYNVILTSDYHAVMDIVKQQDPEMVIVEYRLRSDEGRKLCKQLRTFNNQLILLALSSSVDIKLVYAKEGFDGYISKPFELDIFFDTVNSFFS